MEKLLEILSHQLKKLKTNQSPIEVHSVIEESIKDMYSKLLDDYEKNNKTTKKS